MYSTAMYRSVTHVCFRSLHIDVVALARRPTALVRSRQHRRTITPKVPVNPGIGKSLKMFEYKSYDDIPEEDLLDLEDLETDFMNVNELHKEHNREMALTQDRVRKKVIETKYFKGLKEPKLLTWEEKEQIQYLHKSDPEEWNSKKLSECFPATEDTVKKILKAHWRPEAVERILKYNEGVVKNWKLLSEGKLEINEELRKHLSQFTSREKMILKPPDPGVLPPAAMHRETISHEFSDIIDSYRKESSESRSNNSKPFSNSSHRKPAANEDTFVLEDNERRDVRHMTLDKYTENILKYRKKFDALDKAIVDHYADNALKSPQPEPTSMQVNKFERGRVEVKPVPVPPQKIRIPAHLKGKSGIFKLEDCFYDRDGSFLYRVPGMTS